MSEIELKLITKNEENSIQEKKLDNKINGD